MKILNFGSLNIDYVYQVDHFVCSEETISSRRLDKYGGGKGLNQSIAASRAGGEVWHAGAIGKADGLFLKALLTKSGVNTQFVMERVNSSSGHAIIQVTPEGQNNIILYGGANQTITIDEIHTVLKNFDKGDILLLQNEISNIDQIIKKASQIGMQIVMNPSPLNEKLFSLPLQLIDYFILNEVEANQLINGDFEDYRLLEEISKKYPNAKIVLTLGSRGVKYFNGHHQLSHGIYDVEAIDTTAAGDTFTGYFFAQLSRGVSVKEALELSSKASALTVSAKGAEASIPWLDKVKSAQLEIKQHLLSKPNPNSTGNGDFHLDQYRNPTPKGSNASHLYPQKKEIK